MASAVGGAWEVVEQALYDQGLERAEPGCVRARWAALERGVDGGAGGRALRTARSTEEAQRARTDGVCSRPCSLACARRGGDDIGGGG